MRDEIKYVDAEHKFGKTVLYGQIGGSGDQPGYLYKDAEQTVPVLDSEIPDLFYNGCCIKIVDEGYNATFYPIILAHNEVSGDTKYYSMGYSTSEFMFVAPPVDAE